VPVSWPPLAAALLLLATQASQIPAPDLDALDPLVKEQIIERQQWHRRRTVDGARTAPLERAAAYGELGALYHSYGLFDAAEPCYRTAAELRPDDFRWPYYLGLLHRSRNEPGEAIASFERALQLAPRDVPTLVRLAEVELDQNRPERAATWLDRAIALDSRNAAALAARGQIALSRRQFREAAQMLERALTLQPDASTLRSPLAMAYRGLGDAGKARAAIERHGPGAVTLVDPLLRKLHGLARAQREHQQRGTEAIAAGQIDAAIAAFRQAVAEDPLYSLPRVHLALALLRAGKSAEAADELTVALEHAPGSARAHFGLGYVRAQQRRPAEAVEQYRATVVSDPGHVDAWFNLATTLGALHRYQEAADAYASAVRLRPEWAAARLREANALVMAGRLADARRRLEAAAAAHPRDGYIAHALARLLATAPEAGERDGGRALAVAEALFKARASREHAETVAMALAEERRFAEAVQWQRDAIALATREAAAADLNILKRRLATYEKGEPCRAPWQETGELVSIEEAAR
jgi:tetratricopeptide (TPR) repeat protein